MHERPPDPWMVEQYRAAFGTGPEAAAWLREVADAWEQTGRTYVGADRPEHWNDGLDGYGHAADPRDCCQPE